MALKFLVLLALLGAAVSSEDNKKSPARCYDQHPPFEQGCEKSATLWFYNETLKNCEPRTTPLWGAIMWKKNVFKNEKFCKKLCRDPVLEDCAAPEPKNVMQSQLPHVQFNPDKMRCECLSYEAAVPRRASSKRSSMQRQMSEIRTRSMCLPSTKQHL
uniref:Putative serine proteinase inhibitor n=1 Tax=Ixodes scapularis TaxID=6945 RepID=A0A4D5S5Y9_IXOSC